MKAIIAASIVFCCALIGVTYYFATHENTGPRLVPLDASYAARQKDRGWTIGSTTPKVEVLEYGDFQCPACALASPIIREAAEQTKDIARLTFRNFPLTSIHNNAMQAAKIAESAGKQGKFWEMEELLYSSQNSWSTLNPSAFSDLGVQYAGSLGLNTEQFKRDVKDASVEEEITKDVAIGDAVPIQHTPTLLINDKEVQSIPSTAEELAALIRNSAK